MDKFGLDILVGICSGLLIMVIVHLFKSKIVPLWKRYIQNSPSLDGSVWRGVQSDGRPAGSTLKVSQHGNLIKATVELIRPEKKARVFRYSGKIVGHQIVLTWDEPDTGGIILGAFVLRLTDNFRKLIGKTVYVNLDSEGVNSSDKIYERVSG